MSKPKYITPRLAIVEINPYNSPQTILAALRESHGIYFHVFNLTQIDF
jgi:hypothetical protein